MMQLLNALFLAPFKDFNMIPLCYNQPLHLQIDGLSDLTHFFYDQYMFV